MPRPRRGVRAGRLSRCGPPGQAPGQGHLCSSLCCCLLVRSVDEEPAGAHVGESLRCGGWGSARGPTTRWSWGLLGSRGGPNWSPLPRDRVRRTGCPLGIWPRASAGQLPGMGSPPRILVGGQASHPQSSCHAQSSALWAGPQSQSRRRGSPASLLSPAWVSPLSQQPGPGSVHRATGLCPPARLLLHLEATHAPQKTCGFVLVFNTRRGTVKADRRP